jgi:hypothetical protein
MIRKLLAPLAAAVCMIASSHAAAPATFTSDFMSGPDGWTSGFGDYPVGSEKFYELESGMRVVPLLAKMKRNGFLLSGNNHSDDLCMFMKRRVTGLAPNTRYRVQISVTFASASPKDAVGVGGAPSIPVKAGVCHQRPSTKGKYARLTIDKGNQSTGGKDAMVIGNTGVDVEPGSEFYRLKTLTNKGAPFSFETDADGKAWLFVCTDSGFEATTSVYFTRISVRFIPR